MENPLAWNEVEKTIDRAMRDWETFHREHPDVMGRSEVRAVYLALKEAGFLRAASDA